jgi:hypothetical protein
MRQMADNKGDGWCEVVTMVFRVGFFFSLKHKVPQTDVWDLDARVRGVGRHVDVV